jgi:hypothetical protein
MSYPSVEAPYGLVPINRVDFMPYAGATRQLPIASTYNTAIFNGDIVTVKGGSIQKSTVTTDSTSDPQNATTLTYGVFVGVQYVNSQGQTVQAQYYPGNAAASSAVAYVVDDSQAAFKVAITFSGNATVTTANASVIGTNLPIRQGSGSTITGNSGVSVAAPTSGSGSAAALPVRVVGVIPETARSANAFTEVVVKFNNPQILLATAQNYL